MVKAPKNENNRLEKKNQIDREMPNDMALNLHCEVQLFINLGFRDAINLSTDAASQRGVCAWNS